jgi:hypothetical protein
VLGGREPVRSQSGYFSTPARYISLFACDNSHYLYTDTRARPEKLAIVSAVCANCSARRAPFLRWTARLRCVATPAGLCTSSRPILNVAHRIMPPEACCISPEQCEPARICALTRVCLRGIRTGARAEAWCLLIHAKASLSLCAGYDRTCGFVLAGTTPVARRLGVGRAAGQCLAAMAQT